MFAADMNTGTKKILGTIAVAAAVGGGFYLYNRGRNLLQAGKLNIALLGFKIHKLNFKEVQFSVKLRCYNPTNEDITLAVNQATAIYKDSDIAYSVPDVKGTSIQAGSTQEISIRFQVPYMNVAGKGIVNSLLQNARLLFNALTLKLRLTVNGESITTTQQLSNSNMNGIAALPMGQLGIVSGPRNTQDGRRFNYLVKKADGEDLFVKTGDVYETVETCIEIVANNYREVEQLAEHLKAGTASTPAEIKATCRNIFNFSYNFLQYKLDKKGTEQLRTPARSWLDGQIRFKQHNIKDSGIDCDDYSIFVGSVLKCLGIPFKFRITKYDGKHNFQHIYVFVPAPGDSEDEIIIDPVLSKFDYQKPYSFEKSDFIMSPVALAGGIHGVNGLSGTTWLGLPISVLSGFSLGDTSPQANNYEQLMGIVSGIDFEESIDGLGNMEDATYRYLVRTRDFLLRSKENRLKMAHIQNPDQFIKMLDEAIKYWNTPQREQVLNKLSDIEERLAQSGFIKYDTDALQGLAELDELEDELDGMYDEELGLFRRRKGKRRRGGFFRSIRRIGKKIGKGIKKAGKAVGKAAKKVGKAIVRFNPLSIAIRNGLLAALRLNMFGIAKKLQYAYLPDKLAGKYNLDPAKHARLKKTHRRVRKLFKGLQGKEKNLRKAIIKGAKQKSPDFSLKGFEGVLGELQALEAIGELAELGELSAVATGVSVGAASGVLAKISSWLKPVKNLFAKAKRKVQQVSKKVAQSRVARHIRKGKEVSEKLMQRANAVIPPLPEVQTPAHLAPISPQAEPYIAPTQDTPQVDYSSHIQEQQTPSAPDSPGVQNKVYPGAIQRNIRPPKKGMSKGAKIGIGIGVAALVGTGIYLAVRNSKQSKPKVKKQLGAIQLQ